MTVPNDFVQANTRMLDAYTALVPVLSGGENQASLDQLTAILSGVIPPERVSEFAEFGYAKADLLDAAAKEAFADVCAFATMNGFYGLGADGRGMAMERILRGQDLPEGVEAPEPSSKYVPPVATGPEILP